MPTRFERCYATNPVCVPSRFSLQTGFMPSAIGMQKKQTIKVDIPDNQASKIFEGIGSSSAA
jgi:arylsulfatase A-like enzyme